VTPGSSEREISPAIFSFNSIFMGATIEEGVFKPVEAWFDE
jgi:hypothetical protein